MLCGLIGCFIICLSELTDCVMTVLLKMNRCQVTQRQAQPTGCPLSHQCPRYSGLVLGDVTYGIQAREVSSHEFLDYIHCGKRLCAVAVHRVVPVSPP